MTKAEILQSAIRRFPAGKIFSYSDLADTDLKHNILVTEMNRLVKQGQVARVLRGRFVAVSGKEDKVSPGDIIGAICHYRNKVCGYETGPSVWERWGLLPEMKKRREFYICINQMRPAQVHGGLTIRFKRAKLDPARYNHQILQFLDALESVNTLAPKSGSGFFKTMTRIFCSWNESTRNQLASYALAYRPVTRALAGVLLQNAGYSSAAARLAASLHPATTYKVNADCSTLPNIDSWRIISCSKASPALKPKQKTA